MELFCFNELTKSTLTVSCICVCMYSALKKKTNWENLPRGHSFYLESTRGTQVLSLASREEGKAPGSRSGGAEVGGLALFSAGRALPPFTAGLASTPSACRSNALSVLPVAALCELPSPLAPFSSYSSDILPSLLVFLISSFPIGTYPPDLFFSTAVNGQLLE